MYSGPGTQVCTSVPPPGYFGLPFPGSYPPVYPTNTPYFAQSNCYQYQQQDAPNFGPVDGRFSQQANGQIRNNFQAPVGPPLPMNMPVPYSQYNAQFSFPPPMPPHQNYHILPPNVMPTNHFPNPPPSYPPQVRTNQKDRTPKNGERLHPYRHNNQNFQMNQNAFHCGVCDKGFHTENKYQQHVAQHVSCGLEGCTYKANPLLVEKHIAMQHRNGLFKRIAKGNTPEEIEKWIKERKKHYPTVEKIAEKLTQKTEMEKRGERYNDRRKTFKDRLTLSNERQNRQQSSFGNKKTFGGNSRKFEPNRAPRNSDRTRIPRKKESNNKILDIDFEFCRKLPPFQGTESYLMDLMAETKNDDHYYSDSDPEESKTDVNATLVNDEDIATVTSKPSRLLSSLDLIRGYDSQEDSDCEEVSSPVPLIELEPPSLDEDDDSEPEECSSKLPVPDFILGNAVNTNVTSDSKNAHLGNAVNTNVTSDSKNAQKSSSIVSTSEVARSSENEEDENSSKKSKRRRRKNRNGKSDEDNGSAKSEEPIEEKPSTTVILPRKRYRRPTLLEKLLAPEIKHERNTILQCVRYVVNNNFFGIGSSSKTGTGTTKCDWNV